MSVAVVVPLFDGAAFIGRALDSIAEQTLPPREVIVVDDGSRDDGAAVVRRYAQARDLPFELRLLERPNGGPAAARNTGIRAATSELIAFLDADDGWEPGKLKLCTSVLAGLPSEVAGLHHAARIVEPDGRSHVRACPGSTHPGYERQLREGNDVVNSATVVRRARLLEVGLLDESPALRGVEDFDLWLRLSIHGGLACRPEALTRYRSDAGLSSNIPRQKRALASLLRKHASRPEARLSALTRADLLFRATRLELNAARLQALGRTRG